MMIQNKRIVWIDQLKGFIFFLVILGHLPINDTLGSYIYSFHMPIYFLISGFNFNIDKLLSTKPKDYLIKLSTRMLIPYVWLQLITMCIRFYEVRLKGLEVPASRYIKGMLIGNSKLLASTSNPMYFILLLFLAEVALFFLIKLVKGNKTALYASCILLLPFSLFTINKGMVWHLNVVPVAMLFIMMGRSLMDIYKANEEKIKSLSKMKFILVDVLLIAFGAAVWLINGRISIHHNYYGKDFLLATMAALSTSIGVSLIFTRLPDFKPLAYIGKYTFFYLGVHKPIILLFKEVYKHFFHGKVTNPIFITVSALVIFFALIPVTKLCEKTAPFLLGLKSSGSKTELKIGQLLSTVAASCIPYVYFLRHFKGGFLISSLPTTVFSVILYIVIVTVGFILCRKIFTFVYLFDKAKPSTTTPQKTN